LLNEDGKPNQFIVIRKDITKEKEAENEILEYASNLERINKELDQFAYVVSHDLKAPLRAINNLSVWIEEDLDEKLSGDVRTNMEYSRIGRKRVSTEIVDVNELLSDIVSPEFIPSNFRLILPDDFPIIRTERVALEQVFSNLIGNSIKYNTNPNPKIEVGFSENVDFYEFFVADNGPGIDPQYHDQVFVIFQTLQSRDKFESTGVGLAIVKKIIQEKGGKVWISSLNGHGVKFSFTWPKYVTNN
jgi:light-regulated signal transduction histidine kinase (bacteriophytochrome)